MFLFDHKIWRGESGRLYRFKVTLTRKGIPDHGGIYIFVRRYFGFFLRAVYVGKATNFRERLFGHEKFARAVFYFGATERHVLRIATEEDRASVEEDLIRGLKPVMNDVCIPRSADDKRNYEPRTAGWSIANRIRVIRQDEARRKRAA